MGTRRFLHGHNFFQDFLSFECPQCSLLCAAVPETCPVFSGTNSRVVSAAPTASQPGMWAPQHPQASREGRLTSFMVGRRLGRATARKNCFLPFRQSNLLPWIPSPSSWHRKDIPMYCVRHSTLWYKFKSRILNNILLLVSASGFIIIWCSFFLMKKILSKSLFYLFIFKSGLSLLKSLNMQMACNYKHLKMDNWKLLAHCKGWVNVREPVKAGGNEELWTHAPATCRNFFFYVLSRCKPEVTQLNLGRKGIPCMRELHSQSWERSSHLNFTVCDLTSKKKSINTACAHYRA